MKPTGFPVAIGLALAEVAFLIAGCGLAARPEARTIPFGGKPHPIPGTIEAEAFDEGPAGVAYRDLDRENQGAPYRAAEVDVEARPDASGGYGVGWTRAGEWLVYTVEIAEAGAYAVEIPAASPAVGSSFHLEVDGKDVSGPIEVPSTGSWEKLGIIRKSGLVLPAGRHQLKLVFDRESSAGSVADIDLLRFRKA
jgi:hypothetical protein